MDEHDARTISSDGRYIGFITPDRSLAVHDIQNDVTTVLVPRVRQQGTSGSPESPALSRDGRRIAYTWFETGRRRQMPSGKAFLGVSADVSGASLASLPWRYRTPLRCRLEAPRRGWAWERP